MINIFERPSVVINEHEIKARDEILIYQHQFDYWESEFGPLNDKVQLSHNKFRHEYPEMSILSSF